MSRFEFRLPDIGEGVTEGEIVSWLVKPGETVDENQEMVEVMTDKATVTIGAPKSGKILETRGKEGDVVPVGEVLVVFDVEGGAGAEPAQPAARREPAPPPPAREKPPVEPAAAKPAPELRPAPPPKPAPAPAAAAVSKNEEGPAATAVGDIREVLPGMGGLRPPPKPVVSESGGNGSYYNEHPLAAPATRKFAREVGIDLRRVPPTGPVGRVTHEDVERQAAELRAARPAPASIQAKKAPAQEPTEHEPAEKLPAQPSDERVPIRGMRKRIFENMARSKHTAAHFTYVDECDASALKALRERVKPHAEQAGVKLSFLPFIIKAVVCALKKHPALNCLVDDDAHEMVLKKSHDIGIATATEAGLMVPVVRGADRRNIIELGAEVERLSRAAREGKIRKEELGGSSFTITSLGKLGGLFATPIVNYPEVAILGVHEIKRRPIVKNDQIVIGDVMLLSLSFDHRIIDGHVGAAFASEVIGYLEDPDRLLLELV